MGLTAPSGEGLVSFCVLDGHMGSKCVDHLVERLPANLQTCLSAKPSLTDENLRRAVLEACHITDQEFLARAKQLELMDGSTMILGIIFPADMAKQQSSTQHRADNYKLMIANVGDSRAVLCRAS